MKTRWMVCLLAWVVVLAAATHWLARDRMPGGYEVPHHLRMAQEIGFRLDRARASGTVWRWADENRRWYTRSTLIHMLCGPLLNPVSPRSITLVSLLVGGTSLALLLWAICRLGRHFADDEAAMWAVAVVALLPGVWGMVRKFGVDLPLTALVTCTAALVVDGRVWRSGRRALIVGVVAGSFALIKAQAILWLPWILLSTLVGARGEGRALIGRVALLILGAAIGSAAFWAGDLGEILALARQHMASGQDPSHLHAPALSIPSLLYYGEGCWYWLSPPALLALLVGAAVLIARRQAPWMLVLWTVGGYVMFTLILLKWRRYYFPAMPALALLGVLGLRTLPGHRWILGALVLWLAGLLPFASTTWAPELVDFQVCHPPRAGNWHEIAGQLQRATARRPPGVIGIRAPRSWQPDDYRMMEMYLNARWPAAYVCSYCPEDGPEALANYRKESADFDLELHVGAGVQMRRGWRWLRVDDLIHAGHRLDDRHPVVALWREK